MMVLGDLHASLGAFVKHYYGEDVWATALDAAGRNGAAAGSTGALNADPILEGYVTTALKIRNDDALGLAANSPASLPTV